MGSFRVLVLQTIFMKPWLKDVWLLEEKVCQSTSRKQVTDAWAYYWLTIGFGWDVEQSVGWRMEEVMAEVCVDCTYLHPAPINMSYQLTDACDTAQQS